MNDTHTNVLEQNLGELFGFEEMSEEEKAALLDDVGTTILESAILRFAVEGDTKDVETLEQIAAEHAESEDMFKRVLEALPQLETILEEEILAFKQEAMAVLG